MTSLDGYVRFAVFWAPPAGSPLARFGACWLGWDAATGRDVPRMAIDLPRPLPEMTRAPWRYGMHGTLKAPFRLAPGEDPAALDAAVAALATGTARLTAPGLAPTAHMGFAALTPTGPSPALDALAGTCVEALDRFRAPPRETELARRRSTGLSTRQEEHLLRWGYPYVFDEFRFHVTLSGRLRPGEAEAMLAVLTPVLGPILGQTLQVADICLFGDPGANAGFRLLRRYPLAGAAA